MKNATSGLRTTTYARSAAQNVERANVRNVADATGHTETRSADQSVDRAVIRKTDDATVQTVTRSADQNVERMANDPVVQNVERMANDTATETVVRTAEATGPASSSASGPIDRLAPATQTTKPKSKLKSNKKRFVSTESIIKGSSVLIILALWYVITKLELVSPLLFPSPAATWATFTDLLVNGYKGTMLWEHLGASMYRMLVAFLLAAVTAIPLGLWSGYSTKVQAALDPLVEFYRPIPPLAYYTLLILMFGIGDMSKIVLLYLAAFAPMYIAAMSAVRGVLEDRILSAQSLGASKIQLFRYVIFPSSLPGIFTGMRTALGFTYTTLVASEIVAAVNGIGWMVLDASNFLRSDIMLVGIIIMGFTGILLDGFIRIIERKAIPWKGKEK